MLRQNIGAAPAKSVALDRAEHALAKGLEGRVDGPVGRDGRGRRQGDTADGGADAGQRGADKGREVHCRFPSFWQAIGPKPMAAVAISPAICVAGRPTATSSALVRVTLDEIDAINNAAAMDQLRHFLLLHSGMIAITAGRSGRGTGNCCQHAYVDTEPKTVKLQISSQASPNEWCSMPHGSRRPRADRPRTGRARRLQHGDNPDDLSSVRR